MNFKLKGIELDAFRIYQDKQLFNFLTRSGEIANLIVIYAPNGYGKTSFIDGVEWALTGKINRISNNTILKNTADSEKGVILKNRKSDKEYGTVRIIAENGEFLEKNTKVIGRNGRKTDYAEGDTVLISDIFNSINLSDFSTKSILGQDKIDSFLRSVNPRERYDTLTNFWDNENDSEVFKSILSMNSESEKQQKMIEEQLQKISDEIESLVLRPNIISEINGLVKNFNHTKLVDLKLPLLDRKNNQEFVNLLINTNSRLISIKLENESNLVTAEYLVKNFVLFNQNVNELLRIKDDLEELTLILNKFKKREERSSALNIVVSQVYVQYGKYRNFKELLKHYNNFEEIHKRIFNLEESIRDLTKETSNLNSLKLRLEQQLTHIQNELKNVKKEKDDYEKNHSKLDSNLDNYNNLQNRKYHLSKRSSQLKNLISIRRNNKQEIIKKKLTLESLFKYDIQNIININNDNNLFRPFINDIKKSYEFIIQKQQELKQLELEYTKLGKLNQQLNTIFKVGKKFIEESRAASCPLCKKEYENFETLIENVDKDFIEVDSLNRIINDIENVKKEINEEENNMNTIIKVFKKEIEKEINILIEKEVNIEAKIASHDSLNERINSKLNNISLEEDYLISFFKDLKFVIENNDPNYVTNFKISMNEELARYSVSIGDYNNKVNENIENQRNLSTNLQRKELEIQFNKNIIRELREDQIIKRVNQLIEDLKVDKRKEKIKEAYEVSRQDLLELLNNRTIILNQINILNQELENIRHQEKIDENETKQNRYLEVQNNIDSYMLKLKTVLMEDTLTKENFSEEDILLIHRNINHEKNNIKEGLSLLNKLMEFTKYIENNIELKTKESKKRDLEEHLIVLNRGNEELSRAKDDLTKYIKTKIDNTFNLDSINRIYQRIDPHPDFNNIKFETDLTKEKPELNIYASSRNETLAPILFFSAAQVNILSLSIFLAKALIREEGLNTIFMDDPIQHLDNLNILSFIDLLRSITNKLDKQVILSTHNENFYKLIKRKMDPKYTKSKFIELESFGKIKLNN